ncbi:CYTH domain-containing protein [Nakamurella lactea]|uniref:hypothetical protein n=1 Tax=Nakamurella lactea TaxID=459515 RepID=UPI000414E8DB|nr:hypothetical protein [Nakamurella lactea]
MTAATRLISDQLVEVLELVRESDSIELKMTVPDHAYRSAGAALGVDPLQAQIRQVFFFDTPDLRLDAAGVVVRARRVQGRGDDSVVKLRPVKPSDLPSDLRRSPEFVVEVDAMPGGYVCSASLKHRLASTDVGAAAAGQKPLHKVFSKAQRAFFAAHAPDGLALDDLAVLGPIFVLKLVLRPEPLNRKLVVEMWMYPDGSRVVELSTKCRPGEAMAVGLEGRQFLEARGISLSGRQQTKTRTALKFFSKELQALQV